MVLLQWAVGHVLVKKNNTGGGQGGFGRQPTWDRKQRWMRDECDENPTVNSMPRGLKYGAGHNHDDDLGSVVLVGVTAGPPFSELSHQSCPFQEGYLRIFSVTFLQISRTCFPARFLVTIIFQQLSCQLITGRNTKLPTTLRGLQQPVGKMFCGQEKATPTGWCCNNNATTTQSGKTTSVHDHKAFS